jgi:hypothetical protein
MLVAMQDAAGEKDWPRILQLVEFMGQNRVERQCGHFLMAMRALMALDKVRPPGEARRTLDDGPGWAGGMG